MLIEIFGEALILIVVGLIFSYVLWRVFPKRITFGDFLNKYGYWLAYAGIFFVVAIIILINSF